MTTPDESISAQAGVAHEPPLGDERTDAGPHGTDEAGAADVESATDAVPPRLADLPDEPGEPHVAAYAAAADELARRLDGSGSGHDDDSP